jgi:formylglycine-generating enzyme required for sulfatase activity
MSGSRLSLSLSRASSPRRFGLPPASKKVYGSQGGEAVRPRGAGGSPAGRRASGDGVAGKIFISYRREDAKAEAARLRDRLADAFGAANVFMDVDNLRPGERFDLKLKDALAETDVFLAAIGPRWSELLAARMESGEHDYVRAEIAAALARKITVIPVLMDRAPMPRAASLPGDMRDLALYQKHDIAHESFGRDAAALIGAIKEGRRARSKPLAAPWKPLAALAAVAAGAAAYVLTPPKGPDPAPQPVVVQPPRETPKPAPAPSPPPRQEAAAQPRACGGGAVPVALATGEKRCIEPGSGAGFKDCPDCPEMAIVPAGNFAMGSPDGVTPVTGLDGRSEPGAIAPKEEARDGDEGPRHRVKFEKPFALGRFAVTFAEWDACVAAKDCGEYKPDDRGWGRGDRPVINVSWDDAKAYVAWLSKKTGKSYRLLTEAEREYAARAGTASPYWWGSSITHERANYSAAAGKTLPVKSFEPNPWGLYQVHGNVWEWVEDCWRNNYNGAPSDGSAWTGGGCSSRVLRGGSWISNPRDLRAADRDSDGPQYRGIDRGFRVALGWQDLNR